NFPGRRSSAPPECGRRHIVQLQPVGAGCVRAASSLEAGCRTTLSLHSIMACGHCFGQGGCPGPPQFGGGFGDARAAAGGGGDGGRTAAGGGGGGGGRAAAGGGGGGARAAAGGRGRGARPPPRGGGRASRAP